MVKVEAKKFAEFISVATLQAKFTSVVLNFRKDGLHVQSKDEDNTIMNLVFMPSENFDVYKEQKNPVGVKSSSMLLSIIKSFSGIINLDITDDLVTLYNEKKLASLKTANVLYLDGFNMTAVPGIFEKFDSGVKLSTEILKNTVKNISIVKSDNVDIKFENNILTLQTGDDGFDKISEKVPCAYSDVSSNYNSELFKSAVSVLGEEVVMSIPNEGFPVQLTTKTETLSCRLLIAPNNSPAPAAEKVEEKKPKTEEKKIEVKDVEVKKVTTDTTIKDLVDDEKSLDKELELLDSEEEGLL